MEPSRLTDLKLLELCSFWGSQARRARTKFMSLLPEVNRRNLYIKKGFNSIFEYAFKTAGLNDEQVRTALRLHNRIEDKPELKKLYESGEVSLNKIEKVSYIATAETESLWAKRVEGLSAKTLTTMVRDERSLDVQTSTQQIVEIIKEPILSDEVKKKLNELQSKSIDINAIILEALKKREEEIEEEKTGLAEKAKDKLVTQIVESRNISRHIPVAIKRLSRKEFGDKCAIETCNNKAESFHHTARFSISDSHNPYFIAQLCKAHHEAAHFVDAKAMEKRKGS